jgi:predicted nucleic acid-binding protein
VIVVADAGPLHYLILLGRTDLLETLFGEVIIPRAVGQELEHPNAPAEVRKWLGSPPSWARVVAAASTESSLPLGSGEREAIAVALELKADLLLMDDRKGRRIAREQGIPVAGTLGVLRAAYERGLIELSDAITRLVRHGFRLSDRLARQILRDLSDEPPSPE